MEVKLLCTGGLSAAEELIGHEKAVIVDAMVSREDKIGTIRKFDHNQLSETVHLSEPHQTNFASAVEVVAKHAPRFPNRITIYAILITQQEDFREGLSQGITHAAEECADLILEEVGKGRR